MKTNILKALINLDKTKQSSIMQIYTNNNRINSVGDSLEYYIKDLFSHSFEISKVEEKDKIHKEYFSYLGSANRPPDAMINGGDAIEVKKIESQGSRIALNSSAPKKKLYYDNPKISKDCRKAESSNWEEKDLIYIIGVVKKGELKLLWFIHGECYAASSKVYNKLAENIKKETTKAGYEFTETKELGKVKGVDPLQATDLRIRAMWHIDNPLDVFEYLDVKFDKDVDLTVYSIMTKDKYDSFPVEDKEELENTDLKVEDVEIKSPDNPEEVMSAKFIKGIYKDL